MTYNILNYSYDLITNEIKVYSTGEGDRIWKLTKRRTGEVTTSEATTVSPYIETYTFRVYRGEDSSDWGYSKCELTWKNNDYEITTVPTTLTATEEATVNAGWLVTPNVFIDSGKGYALWCLNTTYNNSNSWSGQIMTTGCLIEESGVVSSWDWDNDTYTIQPDEYVTITTNYNVARSVSAVNLQGLFIDTVRLCNSSATSAYSMYNNGGTAGSESTSSKYLEYTNSNTHHLRYYPGTNNDSSFNYFGFRNFNGDSVGYIEDSLIIQEQGYRTQISDTHFNICFNTDSSNISTARGLSYSEEPERMGTLLTAWTSVDQDFYIAANSDTLIYRDVQKRY